MPKRNSVVRGLVLVCCLYSLLLADNYKEYLACRQYAEQNNTVCKSAFSFVPGQEKRYYPLLSRDEQRWIFIQSMGLTAVAFVVFVVLGGLLTKREVECREFFG